MLLWSNAQFDDVTIKSMNFKQIHRFTIAVHNAKIFFVIATPNHLSNSKLFFGGGGAEGKAKT